MSTVSPAVAAGPGAGRSVRLSRLSDELLARYAARGSERAFTAIYERYYQPLYRYCRSIVRDDVDAQDALQSTFTGALAALQRDGRNAPLRPWLYRIAHNESISLLRRRKRDAQHEVVTEASVVGSSAEDQAADRARWRRLVDDLGALPERQRGALLLRELAGLSHEDIALTLGLTVGAAKQAIFEARQGLAEVEEGRAMSCEEVRLRISEGDRRVLRARRVRSHLRECSRCEAFAVAIPARQTELRAMAPALPPAAAAALLGRVIGSASSHGGASAAAGTAAGAGAFGKAAGTVVAWKAVTGAAILATAAAGVTGLTHVLEHSRGAAPAVLTAKMDAAAAAGSDDTAASAGGRPSAVAGTGHSSTAAPAAAAATNARHHGLHRTGAGSAAVAHRHSRAHHGAGPRHHKHASSPAVAKGHSNSHAGAVGGHSHSAAASGVHGSAQTHTTSTTAVIHRSPRVALHSQVHTPSNPVSTVTNRTSGASNATSSAGNASSGASTAKTVKKTSAAAGH
jgi:RNA polymerase sigma factor (sigma-70 family)